MRARWILVLIAIGVGIAGVGIAGGAVIPAPATGDEPGEAVVTSTVKSITFAEFKKPFPTPTAPEGAAVTLGEVISHSTTKSRGPRGIGTSDECLRPRPDNVELMCGGVYPACWETTVNHGSSTTDTYVWQRTRFCSNNGETISDYSSFSWSTAEFPCGTTHGPDTWVAGGGVGQGSVDIRSQAEYQCGSTYMGTTWFTKRWYAYGAHATAGHH